MFTALPFFFSSVLQIDRFRAISVSALHPSSPSPPHPAPHRAEGPQGGGEKTTPQESGRADSNPQSHPHRRAAEKTHISPPGAGKEAGGTIPSSSLPQTRQFEVSPGSTIPSPLPPCETNSKTFVTYLHISHVYIYVYIQCSLLHVHILPNCMTSKVPTISQSFRSPFSKTRFKNETKQINIFLHLLMSVFSHLLICISLLIKHEAQHQTHLTRINIFQHAGWPAGRGPFSSLKTRNGTPFGSLFGPIGRSGGSKFRRGSQISTPFLGLSPPLLGGQKNIRV